MSRPFLFLPPLPKRVYSNDKGSFEKRTTLYESPTNFLDLLCTIGTLLLCHPFGWSGRSTGGALSPELWGDGLPADLAFFADWEALLPLSDKTQHALTEHILFFLGTPCYK